MDQLTIRRVPLSHLHLDPANARAHPDENMAAIEGSLRRFAQVEPLIVQRSSGRIIGGNGRLVAMRKLGWTECDIVELEIDDLTATALGIALNRSAESAEWNEPALGKLLRELQEAGAIDGIGFGDDEINELLSALEDQNASELNDPGAQEPPENPVTRTGDLWLLDDHRLLCGDSTSEADMARLMNRDTADLLATDPPYLVDYDGTNHRAGHHEKAGRSPKSPGLLVGNKRWDAYVDPATSVAFFSGFLSVALAHCIERVPIYQWHATRRQKLVEEAWEANGLLVHQTIIWSKPRGVLTHSHFLWAHEPCFYGWREGHMPERRPDPSARTVWEIDQQGEEHGLHPTMKPVEVFRRPIGWHTLRSEVCLEPFSGSGTQIIAAEELGRRCYAMEISPAFVDAAVRRWEQATGKSATLDGDGRTFTEIAKERVA